MLYKNTHQIIKLFPKKIWEISEVKNYMRVEGNYDDSLINSLIDAAIIAAENFIKLNLALKLIRFNCNLPNTKEFYLKYCPLKEVVKVILCEKELETTLQKEQYLTDMQNSTITLKQALNGKELIIEYISGFEQKNIPSAIKHGILLHITEMYDRQEHRVIGLSPEIKNLYLPYRRIRI